ncbi:MAG TPA: hypothetical protein VFR47_23855 [Anaerolineales bacterium]|nr:hypothetical protein [Anaerolineales bacterium]
MPKDIFISYSRRDQEFVTRLASDLDARIALASAVIIGSVILINYARQLTARKPEEQLVPEEIE